VVQFVEVLFYKPEDRKSPFPMGSVRFFVVLILPSQPPKEMSTRDISYW